MALHASLFLETLLAAGLAQSGDMSAALARCRADDLVARSKAVAALQEAFRRWTDEDLAELTRATASWDPDLAAVARVSLDRIRAWRAIPDAVWKRFPTAGPRREGDPDEVAALLDDLELAWKRRELGSIDVLSVAEALLDDERETSRTWCDDCHGDRIHCSVGTLARGLFIAVVPKLQGFQESLRDWWARHRDRPEREWHLPELHEKAPEYLRASAIRRLLSLGERDVLGEVFKALQGIEDAGLFEQAVDGAEALPPDVLQALTRYLADARWPVRFTVARLLWTHDRAQAVEALAEAIELRPAHGSCGLTARGLREKVVWILQSGDPRLVAALKARIRSVPFDLKTGMLQGFADWSAEDALDVLAGALQDAESPAEYLSWGDLTGPRICDVAGFLLAGRLKSDPPGDWSGPFAERDANLSFVWEKYRAARRLAPAAFHAPGTGPVAKAQVEALMPTLLSEAEGERNAALKELSRLGEGCWGPLQDLRAASNGARREQLDAVAADFANTLRSVETGGSGECFRQILHARLHEPFDVEAFAREVLQSWRARTCYDGLEVRIVRGGGGKGLRVSIDAWPRPAELPAADAFTYEAGGFGGMAALDEASLEGVSALLLAELGRDIAGAADRVRVVHLKLEKIRQASTR